jgi:hypothetical protein
MRKMAAFPAWTVARRPILIGWIGWKRPTRRASSLATNLAILINAIFAIDARRRSTQLTNKD